MVGDGRERKSIENLIAKRKLENIFLIRSLHKESVQSLLNHFDVCLINWNNINLYQYGISANKIFDYLYSGKPIVHGYSGYFDYVAHHSAGISVKANSPDDIANAILDIANMTEKQRSKLGQNGKSAALKYYNYETIVEDLEKVLLPG